MNFRGKQAAQGISFNTALQMVINEGCGCPNGDSWDETTNATVSNLTK
jgi:hypothetical protein